VVSTPLKTISQLGLLFPIYGKIKNIANHQPANHCNNHPGMNEHPQSNKLLAVLLWAGPSILINMGGHLLFKNTLLEYCILMCGFKNQLKPMETQWKTNGFKAFLILNIMNPIPNLMNPIFGFAADYLGVNTYSWI